MTQIKHKIENFIKSLYRSRKEWKRRNFQNVVIAGFHHLFGEYQLKRNISFIMLPSIGNAVDIVKVLNKMRKGINT